VSNRSCKKITLNIAEVLISISANGPARIVFPPERQLLNRFSTDEPGDFHLSVQKSGREKFPPFPIKNKIFSNQTTWSYYTLRDENYLWIDADPPEEPYDRMVVI